MTTKMLVAAIRDARRKTPDLPIRVNCSNIVTLDPEGAQSGGPRMELASGQRIDFDDQPLGSTFTDLRGQVHVIAFGRWGLKA
jgi:hypothetical protein